MSQGSLAISAFSTPETQTRDLREAEEKQGARDKCRERSANSMVMAKFDVSEFFAPLEARMCAKIADIESKFDQRCTAIERQLGTRADATSPEAMTQALQAQLDEVANSLKAHISKRDDVLTDLTQQKKELHDKHVSLQSSIDDLWQQMKADRQDSFERLQGFSEALDMRLRRLYDKVEGALCMESSSAVECSPVESSTGGTGVVRFRSAPLCLDAEAGALSPSGCTGLSAHVDVQPSECEGGFDLEATATSVQRFCSVPASALPTRSERPVQSAALHASLAKPVQQARALPGAHQPGHQPGVSVTRSPIMQTRAAGGAAPSSALGIRSVGVPSMQQQQQQQGVLQQAARGNVPQRMQQPYAPLRSGGSVPGLRGVTTL